MEVSQVPSRLRRAIQRHGFFGWLVIRISHAIHCLRSNKCRLSQFNRGGITYLVWINEPTGWKLYFTRSYEAADLREMLSLLRPGDVCMDIGANIGVYALNFARTVGGRGRVIAFEPIRRNALALSLAADLNGFSNVSVETVVVSSSTGEEVVANSPIGCSARTWFRERDAHAEDKTAYLTASLDDYCAAQGIGQVDIIKIDVEGAELRVLRGAEKTLRSPQGPRVILVELDSANLARFGSTPRDVIEFLGCLGYRPFVARRKSGLTEWRTATLDTNPNVFFVRET